MNIRPPLPFEKGIDHKIYLTGPCLLTCGCGSVTARWATLQQQLVTKLPQGKPKSSKIISDWIVQENLKTKWPELKQHTYGIVVAHTDKGLEKVNIMSGTTPTVLQQIGDLIRRSNASNNH